MPRYHWFRHLCAVLCAFILAAAGPHEVHARGAVPEKSAAVYVTHFIAGYQNGLGESWEASCSDFVVRNGFTDPGYWSHVTQPGACLILYGPNTYHYVPISATVSAQCPANASKPGAQCICNTGFTADPVTRQCVLYDVSGTPQPDMCMGPAQDGAKVGFPIVPATGEKILTEVDYTEAAPHGLALIRTYRSKADDLDDPSFGVPASGMGKKWSHSHNVSMVFDTDLLQVVFGDGSVSGFRLSSPASNQWSPVNVADELSQSPVTGQWRLYRASDDTVYSFNAQGRLMRASQRNGWATTYTWSDAGTPASVAPVPGLLIAVTNQFGRSLRLAYDSAQRLVAITAPDGQIISYQHNDKQLAGVTWPDGATRGYLYSADSLLLGITDSSGNRIATYSYDGQARGISTEHAGGAGRHLVSYATDAATVTDALGTQRTYAYGTRLGKVVVTRASLPSGSGDSDAQARIQDDNGLVTQATDFLGVTTLFTWDAGRRLPLTVTRAEGRPEAQSVQTQWHPTLRRPVLITEAGRSTAFTWDDAGNKLAETVTDLSTGQSRTTQWRYNPAGLMVGVTDARGGVWQFGYDDRANRISMKDPLGRQTLFVYDAAGRLLSQSAPNGLVTTYGYDLRSRVTTQNAGGEVTHLTYNLNGVLASATLPNGYAVTYTYDLAERLIAAHDNRGNSVHYTLDAMGNRIGEQVKDAGGSIALGTGRVINGLNRLSAIQGAAGQTTSIGYDANGEPVSETDPLNHTSAQTLDALRRPTTTTLADGATASQGWSALDQLTQVTDPKGVATKYTYNAFDEVLTETSPDIGTIQYTRNAAGDVTAMQDARGQITAITRDVLGRPTEIRYAADHISSFSYDATGAVSRVDDKSGSANYTRDPHSRIVLTTRAVNDNPSSPSQYKTGYSYAGGDLAGISYPSGLNIFYRRTAGRITGVDVQEPQGAAKTPRPIVPLVSQLTHTALGQPKAWAWSNGDTAARSFDADGRMTANEFASYNRDAASRIIGITQNLYVQAATGTIYVTPLDFTAGYDARNRLTSFTRDGSETRYTYDANSNRLTALDKVTSDTDLDGDFDTMDFAKATSQSLAIDPSSNRLLGFVQTVVQTSAGKTRSTVVTPVNYRLDANGSMTSDGLRTFEYDASNRLAKVKLRHNGEAASVSYLTNAMGQRVFKSEYQTAQTPPNEAVLGVDFVNWLKKSFAWLFARTHANASIGTAYIYGDGPIPSYAMLGEYGNGSATGAGRTEYIWLPTEDGQVIPVGMYRNGKLFAIHSDHLGTPRLITNEAKAVVWQWPYSAFGNNKPTGILKATTNPKQALTIQPMLLKATAAIEFNHRMPGQYADIETGGFYNWDRHYSAKDGRFTQIDAIGLMGGWNQFVYSGADALNWFDPDGQAKQSPGQKPEPLPITAPGAGRSFSKGDVFKPLQLPPPGSARAPVPFKPAVGKFCESPSQSSVWGEYANFRSGVRTNGEAGKYRRYYSWDYTHGDIEVFDKIGSHLGSMNPVTGEMHKPPVAGRTIDLK